MSSALKSDVTPKTAVLYRRSPKTLLEYPPERATFYMQDRLIKLIKCMLSHPSVAFGAGLNKTFAQPKLRPPNLGT